MQLVTVGLQKTTLIDYPDLVASTVFTHQCNLRCPYCHNPELVEGPAPETFIGIEDFFSFLNKRKGVLDGVCITGGEPLVYDNLPGIIKRIQDKGLKVKLDTNGTFPKKLQEVFPDYVAMDLKTIPGKYPHYLGGNGSTSAAVIESLEYLKTGSFDFEIRTTWIPGIVEAEDIPELAKLLKGVEKYYITPFRGGVTLDPAWSGKSSPDTATMKQIQDLFRQQGVSPILRV